MKTDPILGGFRTEGADVHRLGTPPAPLLDGDRDRLLGGSDCQVALDELAADEHGLDVARIAQHADVGGRVPVDDDEIS
jgi:hypothetical protein